jgi:RNA polymerase sigma-70 factor, ECF subfamily
MTHRPLDERKRALVEALIRDEWPKLERFFRTKVPPPMVQELAQNTFLTFSEKVDEIRTNRTAYLWAIARHQVLRYWERSRARSSQPFDSTQHSALDVGPTLSGAIDRRNRVLRALQSLPADHQMAIELRHGEGLSLEETAEALGVSLATAKRYLAAGKARLRELLGAEAEATLAVYRDESPPA